MTNSESKQTAQKVEETARRNKEGHSEITCNRGLEEVSFIFLTK